MIAQTLTQLVQQHFSSADATINKHSGLLISNQWFCRDDIGDDGEWTEDLNPIFNGLSPMITITLKLSLLYKNTLRFQGDCLLVKKQTLRVFLNRLKWLSNQLKPMNLNRLSELDEAGVSNLYSRLLERSDKAPNNSGRLDSPIGKRDVDVRAKLLETLCSNYKAGLSPDGLRTSLSEAQYFELLKPKVTAHIEWKEWLKGGSYGEFPLELALTLLMYSISIMRSNSTKLVIALQDAFEEQFSAELPEWNPSKRGERLGLKLRFFHTYNYQTDKIGFTRPRKAHSFYKAVYSAYESRNGNLGGLDNTIFQQVCDYTTARDTTAFACLMVILITSGIRSSEIKSLTKNSFKVDENGHVSFISKIKKTNHSIETERPITGLALEAYTLLNELNMNTNQTSSDPLFTIHGLGRPLNVVSGTNTSSGYQRWIIEKLQMLVSDYAPKEHPAPSWHRFRHTWAELALRRFDGNVHEAVRSHFRHAVGSHMTMRYLKDKYKEDVTQISKEYMSELIGRAARGKEELFGPVGRYILKRLEEMDALTPEEIENLVDEFDIIDPHEYGYCMIRKDQRTQAQCFDKASQTPIYDKAKFEMCGGCVGSLRLANHKDTIIRIGVAAQEHSRVFEEMGLSAITNLSKKTLKLCENAIKDFDNRLPLVEVSRRRTKNV